MVHLKFCRKNSWKILENSPKFQKFLLGNSCKNCKNAENGFHFDKLFFRMMIRTRQGTLDKLQIFKHDKYPQYSIRCNSSYGPTFGGGHDIYISNSCRSLGYSYASKQNFNESKDKLLAGNRNFKVEEYEVFAPVWMI